MSYLFWLGCFFLINPIIGAAVLATLDTSDQLFYKWYEEAPFSGLNYLALLFWPLIAYLILRYKWDARNNNE